MTKHDYGNGMTEKKKRGGKDGRVSKVKLAVGAASLFLFIIGVKRTFQMDEVEEPSKAGDGASGPASGERKPGGDSARRAAPRATR